MNNSGRRTNSNSYSFSSTRSEGDISAYEDMLFNDVLKKKPNTSSVLRTLKGYHSSMLHKLNKELASVGGSESVTTAPTEYSDHSSSFFEPEASVFSNMSTSCNAREEQMTRQVSFEDEKEKEEKRRLQASRGLSKRNLVVSTPTSTVDELLNRPNDDAGEDFPEWKDFEDPFASPPPTPPSARTSIRDILTPSGVAPTGSVASSPALQSLSSDLLRTALQVRSSASSTQPPKPLSSSIKQHRRSTSGAVDVEKSLPKQQHRKSANSAVDAEKNARLAEIERRYKEALECADMLHQELAANDVVAEVSPRQLLLKHVSSRSIKSKSSSKSCAPSVASHKTSSTSKTAATSSTSKTSASTRSGDSDGSGGNGTRGRSMTSANHSRSRAKSTDRTATRSKARARSRSRPRRKENAPESARDRQGSNRGLQDQAIDMSGRSVGDKQAREALSSSLRNSNEGTSFDPKAAPKRRLRRQKSGMDPEILNSALDDSLPSSFHHRDLPINPDDGFGNFSRPTPRSTKDNGPVARRLVRRGSSSRLTMAPVERNSAGNAALSLFLEQQPKPDPSAAAADGWEDETGIWHAYNL